MVYFVNLIFFHKPFLFSQIDLKQRSGLLVRKHIFGNRKLPVMMDGSVNGNFINNCQSFHI